MKLLSSHRKGSLAVRVAMALGLAIFVCGTAPADDKKPDTIKLTIDYNDGVQKVLPALAWTEGMTVLDAMERAKTPAHGITLKYTGKGETAFLTQIDDLKNEGGGKDKKNWQYWVNGTYADRSFGVFRLKPGDEVLWKFEVYRGK